MRKLRPVEGMALNAALSRESKAFSKWSAVLEFVSAVAYEDGTPRVPGYLTLRNRGHCYEITAYDPDSGLRLAVNGPDVDHCYGALNQLLGVEEAPWQEDTYLTERLAKRKKKKT